MPVTQDEVVWAYRLILGREPESQAAIEEKIAKYELAQLRADFLNCEEFARQNSRTSYVIPVGLHLNEDKDNVKLDCTPKQQQEMLDRIAVAWRKFGVQEPYWSVLTADQFRQSEIASSLNAFYSTGEPVVNELVAMLRRNAIDPSSLSHVLDFGCGVGRLSLALAVRFAHVTGADISPAHLKLARDRAMQFGISNAAFVPIDGIDSVGSLPECDLLFSRIVLQHNPPPVILALLTRLLDRVASGGYAIFQVPTFIQGYSFDPAGYLGSGSAQMEMNAVPQRHIFALGATKGFIPLEVRENLDTGDSGMVSQIFLFRRD